MNFLLCDSGYYIFTISWKDSIPRGFLFTELDDEDFDLEMDDDEDDSDFDIQEEITGRKAKKDSSKLKPDTKRQTRLSESVKTTPPGVRKTKTSRKEKRIQKDISDGTVSREESRVEKVISIRKNCVIFYLILFFRWLRKNSL